MKHIFLLLAITLALPSCAADLDRARCRGGGTTFYSEAHTNVGDACDKPYATDPEWCDYYGDGAECCVWRVSDAMQEFCKWTYDTCYEFNGTF